jgi:23S rRNA (guanosine2251-2'-O)-methyltransferase
MEAVAGRRPVLEAVRSGAASEVLVAEGSRSTPGLRDILEAARTAGVPVRRVPADRVAAVAPDARHQGVAARVRSPRTLSESEVARWRWPDDATVVVLDGVTDPHNVGALARTAEAAGASALVLRRRRGAELTSAAVRASAGALLHLPVARVANLPRILELLRDRGFWVMGLDGSAELALDEVRPPPGPVAVVVGSEEEGLSRLVRETCDELVAIPLRGRVASLNVSVAAGVVLFRLAGRRRQESRG